MEPPSVADESDGGVVVAAGAVHFISRGNRVRWRSFGFWGSASAHANEIVEPLHQYLASRLAMTIIR